MKSVNCSPISFQKMEWLERLLKNLKLRGWKEIHVFLKMLQEIRSWASLWASLLYCCICVLDGLVGANRRVFKEVENAGIKDLWARIFFWSTLCTWVIGKFKKHLFHSIFLDWNADVSR